MHRIVIVDDDRHILQLLRLSFQCEGYEVVTAETAHQGLQCIEEVSPDLVVLDLALSPDDGRQVFHEARAAGYAGPILIMSAYGARLAAQELGAEAWLEKPFDAEVLLREVGRLLASKPAS